MAYTDTTTTRRIGGINESDAYNLFRLSSDSDLNSLVQDAIDFAASWLMIRAPNDYPSTNPNQQAMFKRAEACLAMHLLTLHLKQRKALGTHFPYIQEESERFEALVQTDWQEQMRDCVGQYLIVDEEAHPFAAPAMALGQVIDYNSSTGGVILEQQKLDKIIDETTGISVPFPMTRIGGGL